MLRKLSKKTQNSTFRLRGHGKLCLQLSFIIIINFPSSGASVGVRLVFARYFISGDSYGSENMVLRQFQLHLKLFGQI